MKISLSFQVSSMSSLTRLGFGFGRERERRERERERERQEAPLAPCPPQSANTPRFIVGRDQVASFQVSSMSSLTQLTLDHNMLASLTEAVSVGCRVQGAG